MRRVAAVLAALALALPVWATIRVVRRPMAPAAGGGCAWTIDDTYADGNLSEYTEMDDLAADWSVSSEQIKPPTGPVNSNYQRWTSALSTHEHAGCIQIPTIGAGHASNPSVGIVIAGELGVENWQCHVVYYQQGSSTNIVQWDVFECNNADIAWNMGVSDTVTFANGDWLCARLTGTGDSTVVTYWKFTSEPEPYDDATWDAAAADTAEWTDNPPNNSGSNHSSRNTNDYVGLYQSSGNGIGNWRMDNFRVVSLPCS